MNLRRSPITDSPESVSPTEAGILFGAGSSVAGSLRPIFLQDDNAMESQLDELADILQKPLTASPTVGGYLFEIGAAMTRAYSDCDRRLK